MDIKKIAKISAILGAIMGTIALIPYFVFLMFLILFFVSSIIVALYERDLIKGLNYQQTAFWGVVAGAMSACGFFAVFVPSTLVLSLVYKNYLSYGLTYLIKFDALWFLLIILCIVIVICASFNAISLMAFKMVKDINWDYFLRK